MDFTLHRFDVLDSTQIEAKRGYGEGRYHFGDVITARTQDAAYGRRGRAWQAPEGNLYVTWLQSFDPAHLSWAGFAVGLALYDAVKPFVSHEDILHLKWPNDLLLGDRKFTGLLLEVQDDALIIGIGMNITVTPQTDQPVTSLYEHSVEKPSVEVILDGILHHYGHWYALGQAQGFEAMREIWLKRAAFRGKTLTARLADGREWVGIFHDLDKTGALILDTTNGLQRVTAADIYLKTENS